MESKENNYGQNHDAKDQILDIRWSYTKGIVNFKRSFHDKIYIVYMGMNTKFKVDSTSSMHNLSFTTLDKNDFSVKTYLVNYQRSMTRENFWVHTD